MPSDLDGLKVVVTGAAAGIGLATATEFSRRGASVGAIDKDDSTPLSDVEFVRADVTDAVQVHSAIDTIALALGGIDVLVNNAGVSFVGGIEDGTDDDWHHLWDLNVMGYVRCTRSALPHLRQSARGSIVNVSSCTAVTGVRQRALYSATKGAIVGMTLSMAIDLLDEGIRVNCVRPGTVDTPFMSELAAKSSDPKAKRQEFADRQPMGRMVSAEEVAEAIVYLATSRASVGVVLDIDGGLGRLLT